MKNQHSFEESLKTTEQRSSWSNTIGNACCGISALLCSLLCLCLWANRLSFVFERRLYAREPKEYRQAQATRTGAGHYDREDALWKQVTAFTGAT